MDADILIATILRHDRKVSSYKIALIRSLNDITLGYAHLGGKGTALAIPLRSLATFWVAYYWPFTSVNRPIMQGVQQGNKQDISFRNSMTLLHQSWEKFIGGNSLPSDGFYLTSEFQSQHRRNNYPPDLISCFNQAINDISRSIQYPIRYAGPGQYSVFNPPETWENLNHNKNNIICIPGTHPRERCVVVDANLWESFKNLSLWIEALCIHQWSLFTENICKEDRGRVYKLLTARPENRRPLTWERNQVEILMMEGKIFKCPWTGRKLYTNNYDLDHILPLSIYPINELWNLIPSDPQFNRNKKRDRLPSFSVLAKARPHFENSYNQYTNSQSLLSVLKEDSIQRFNGRVEIDNLPRSLANCAIEFIEIFTSSRNVNTF